MGDQFNGHTRSGNVMSILDVAFYCSAAAPLSKRGGSSRAAVMSRAWHAIIAQAPERHALVAELDPLERDTIAEWGIPSPVDLGFAQLTLDNAEKELLVGLDDMGLYVDPTKEDCLTRGYIDLAWVVETEDGRRIAYVADNKMSKYTVDGPWSLQLHAYALAYTQLRDCSAYVCGIWSGTDDEWLWGPMIEVDSPEHHDYVSRVLRAAENNNVTRPTFGAHCDRCYGWRFCPAFALPPRPDYDAIRAEDPNPTAISEALVSIEAQLKALGEAKEQIKLHAKKGLPIINGEYVYKPIRCKGRRTVRVEDVEQAAPHLIRTGQATYSCRWVKR